MQTKTHIRRSLEVDPRSHFEIEQARHNRGAEASNQEHVLMFSSPKIQRYQQECRKDDKSDVDVKPGRRGQNKSRCQGKNGSPESQFVALQEQQYAQHTGV